MNREIVTVCQLNDQWGLWLPGCKEHVTSWCGNALLPSWPKFPSCGAVLEAIKHIKALYRRDYDDELPWTVQCR